MRFLFEIDKKDYDVNAERTYRYSACGLVVRNNTVAMCYIDKHQAYVIPGGGIEDGETMEQAVIREMHEETGLRIIPESIKDYGIIRTIRKGLHEPVYVTVDYYYVCDASEITDAPVLTDKEKEQGYHFGFFNVYDILREDDKRVINGEAPCLFMRDRKLLEQMLSEGYFK